MSIFINIPKASKRLLQIWGFDHCNWKTMSIGDYTTVDAGNCNLAAKKSRIYIPSGILRYLSSGFVAMSGCQLLWQLLVDTLFELSSPWSTTPYLPFNFQYVYHSFRYLSIFSFGSHCQLLQSLGYFLGISMISMIVSQVFPV